MTSSKQNPTNRAEGARRLRSHVLALSATLLLAGACGPRPDVYRNSNVDFGKIERVAVLPFQNLSKQEVAAERVYDVVTSRLLASGAFYVIPRGEVERGLSRAGVSNLLTLTPEDVVKLRGTVKADAVMTGVIREYDELRSERASGNAISLSLRLFETAAGTVIWSASTTRGGVGVKERLLGGGGVPMNDVTEEAVDELLDLLFP